MKQTKIKMITRQVSYGFIAAVMLMSYFPNLAAAAQITARSVVVGSSVASAYTTYAFTFTVPTTGTAIKSVGFAACTTASGACTPAPGFDQSTSTLTSQPSNLDGAGVNTGWTISTVTSGELRLSKSGATVTPQPAITVGFSNVKNPSAANSTFYMRTTTYSDASWSAAIDTGVIATSTAGQITVTAGVDETLTFTLASATVALGTLGTATTGKGTSTMIVATNAATGYTVNYFGTTLTSGAKTIDAMAGAGSIQNSKQFGINLMANATPLIGSNPSVAAGAIGTPSTGYGTADSFKFVASTVTPIATATGPSNSNTFTTSYIANIDGITAAGAYSTAITYTATANF